MSALHPTTYRFRHYRGGQLIWANGVGELDGSIRRGSAADREVIRYQPWVPNALANEGEEAMLDVFFRGATQPSAFYLRLFNDTPIESDSLGDLSGEVTGSGYAAIELAADDTDWPTLTTNMDGDYVVTSDTKQFEAAGTWTQATHLVLATTSDNMGLLIAYAELSTTRQLEENDTLDVDIAITLS